jgi:branched-chain amino acid aminotransferase
LSSIATISRIFYNELMSKIIFLNGQYLPLKKSRISPYDLGFLRGYGVFDFMITANGKPFMPEDHWKRLKLSAGELGLNIPVSRQKYDKIVKRLLSLYKYEKHVIRTIITGGISHDGITPGGNETFLILIEKPHPLPEKLYKEGAKVITVEYLRDCPHAKINNYVTAIKNSKRKTKAGAIEIIYTHQGKVLEASTSNLFLVKNNILITPGNKILFGITRKVVIQLAKKIGYKVVEREVRVPELFSAHEVFLTASNKQIVPVVKVNGKKIGNGKVGKNTRILMEEFNKFKKNY